MMKNCTKTKASFEFLGWEGPLEEKGVVQAKRNTQIHIKRDRNEERMKEEEGRG